MKVLAHFKKQSLEDLLNYLLDIHGLYVDRSYLLDSELIKLLSLSDKYFEQTGNSIKQSEISTLNIYLQTALKGFNPQLLEKIKTGKRNNIWLASYHILTELGIILRTSLNEVEKEIHEASALIEQLVLSAIQSQAINDSLLTKTNDFEKVKILWEELKKNEQINLLDKKLKLSITQDDIFIILDKTITKIIS